MSADDEPKPQPLPIAESEFTTRSTIQLELELGLGALVHAKVRKLTISRQALLHAWQLVGARDGQHQGSPHNGVEERECTDAASGREPPVTALEPHGAWGR